MKKQEQATWGGRFSAGPAALMLQFGESISFDSKLAEFDIACNKAQAKMLAHTGIISETERDEILAGLEEILGEVRAGTLEYSVSLEDIHMNIEQELTKRVPAAAKIHTGRSRNDQVATDMRLFFKHAAAEICKSIDAAADALLDFADKNQKIYIPGYTHLQRAQPVSVAHHMLAYVEMLMRDKGRFETVFDHANWSPLGSGAIAGTTLPLDREFSAKAMGFTDAGGNARLTRNSMDAVSDRDTYIEFAAACAICGLHLSRLAEDFILWNTSEFAFIALPDTFTTGSSLMPQKKNPDSMELIRGKSARLQGNLVSLLTMVKGLPLTYNRDLQEDKPPVFDSFEQLSLCLAVVAQVPAGSTMRAENCAAAVADPLLLATDVADYLVRAGMPFREAHHAVGHLVAKAEALGVPLDKLPLAEAQAVCPKIAADWTDCFNLETAMRSREKPGMPGPDQVAAQIAFWRSRKK